MRYCLLGFACMLLLVSQAPAEPVDSGDISAGAKWLVHIDFDAGMQTIGGKRLYEHNKSFQRTLRGSLEELKKKTGLYSSEDLHGITMYGLKMGRYECIAIVRAKINREIAASYIKEKKGYKSTRYGKYILRQWTENAHTVISAFHGENVSIVAFSLENAKHALDVLDAKKPNLAGTKSLLRAAVEPGTVLLFRAVSIADAKVGWMKRWNEISSFAVAVGETKNGDPFGAMKIVFISSEIARGVQAALKEKLAFAMSPYRENEDIQKMLQGFKVISDKATANAEWHVEWRGSAEQLIAAWRLSDAVNRRLLKAYTAPHQRR